MIMELWWGNRHSWKENTKFRTSAALKQHCFRIPGFPQESISIQMLLNVVQVRQEPQGKPSGRAEQLQWTVLPLWSEQTPGRAIEGIRRSTSTSPGARTQGKRATAGISSTPGPRQDQAGDNICSLTDRARKANKLEHTKETWAYRFLKQKYKIYILKRNLTSASCFTVISRTTKSD